MKKVKPNLGRLKLNKGKVTTLTSGLERIKAGGNDANPDNPTARVTRNNCDLHTIGHDDGSGCLSASNWGWCWCHGL